MSLGLTIAIGVGVIMVAALAAILWLIFHPKQFKQDRYQEKWQDLQGLLKNKAMWPQAVLNADNLLGDALKQKKLRGKSTGERLVKAQRQLTDNDGVWFGHKLRNKIDADPAMKLKESEVKQALVGIRQALKDLGALSNGQ